MIFHIIDILKSSSLNYDDGSLEQSHFDDDDDENNDDYDDL